MHRFRCLSTGFAAGFAALIMLPGGLSPGDRVSVATCVAWVFYGLIDAIQDQGTANASPAEDGTHAGGTKN